jgi:hypothetical protein
MTVSLLRAANFDRRLTYQREGSSIRAKGLRESDEVLTQTVALRIVQTLRIRARRGKVKSVTRAKGVCVWRIPEGPWRPTEDQTLL